MSEPQNQKLAQALDRVFRERAETLKSKTAWGSAAGVSKATAHEAFAGSNATLSTLTKLADAAGMSVPELLEYGESDWRHRVAARALLKHMTAEEIASLTRLLRGRSERQATETGEGATTSG